MAVKIRLKRFGKIRSPHYRIVVADARKKRDGAVIEEIGLYQPMANPSFIKVDSDRAVYWLTVGAQPTEQVAAILKITGDWQKAKGLPGTEGTLKTKGAKQDASELVAAADKAAAAEREEADKAKAKADADQKAAAAAETEAPAAEDLEPGSEEAPAEGETTVDAEASAKSEGS